MRSRALAVRRSWAQALTVYVDIVGHLARRRRRRRGRADGRRAGGQRAAVRARSTARCGPPRPRRRKLWEALDELGTQADILPLRELASAVDLAAESGSRIRETLLAKANALRVRQLTEAEADAQKASETMGIAPALMAIAAVVLIGYPGAREVPGRMSTPTRPPPDERHVARQGAPTMPIQVQIITAFLVLRDRMDDAWRRVRDGPRRADRAA